MRPFHGAPTGTRDPQRTKSTLHTPTGTRDPQRTKSILHFPPSCFHTIDECALIVDGFQFHRNQHREAERVRSYSRDRFSHGRKAFDLTSFSPILMTLKAEKVVVSARSCSLTYQSGGADLSSHGLCGRIIVALCRQRQH